jgi:hypothetical protein
MIIPAPKIGTLQTGSKTQHVDFFENGSKGFDLMSEIYGAPPLNKIA